MFLKKFEAKGFKSFADHTVIDFKHNMIGIIGPNGSGKSNIIDGLKWVLGEQSLKQLRGKHNTDFIFNGSDNYKAADCAQVTLTFDNSKDWLKTELKTIIVTRKLTVATNKNEYFLNEKLTPLNEIKKIFMDTGLNKGSLGIISQGTISWFTEAKSIERRKIFEEASGISKYLLQKKETLNQLEKINVTFEQKNKELIDYEKIINNLKQQVKKANEYLEKKAKIKKIEITLLAREYEKNSLELATLEEQLSVIKIDNQNYYLALTELNNKAQLLKDKFYLIDQEFNKENSDFLKLNNEFQKINIEKQNNQNLWESKLDSKNLTEKLGSLQFLQQSVNENLNVFIDLQKEQNININNFTSKQQQKSKELELLNNKIHNLKSLLSKKNDELNKIQNEMLYRYRYHHGLKTIIENKNLFTGIYDVLENLITIEPEYELAITKALNKNLKNILVKSSEDAKKIIKYLKEHRSGQATIMPLNDLKFKPFSNEHYQILNQINGFVDLANNLVEIDSKFQKAIDSLLNKIIIAEDMDSAINISQYTNKIYRIITLEGDVILPMGIISGGFNKQETNNLAINFEYKKEKLIHEIETEMANLKLFQNEVESKKIDFWSENEELQNLKATSFANKAKIEELEEKLNFYNNELQKYNVLATTDETLQNKIIQDISKKHILLHEQLNRKKDYINTQVQLKQNLTQEIKLIEIEINKKNEEFKQTQAIINKLEKDNFTFSSSLQSIKLKLNEKYQITSDYASQHYNEPLNISDEEAKEQIITLQQELKTYNNINLAAVKELKEKTFDFEQKNTEFLELKGSVDNLKKIINTLNKKATKSFDDLIQNVNNNLPEIINYLFDGGSCQVMYENPDDVLSSGIQIIVNLPGKKIHNLMLLSGGEKSLIALSVLFAILKSSSLPLIILDEAEAALDPANVEKFAKIIKKYSNQTQFLTITHRPGTMEKCDILYGVTMMIKGITKIVNIQLNDKFIQNIKQKEDKKSLNN